MYKILIVDDELLICKGMKSMIERLGRNDIEEVRYVIQPLNALALVKEWMPDIIITDIKMPQIDGLNLIRKLSDYSSHYKFIVLSGYNDFIYVKEAFKLGVVDYLLKPVIFEELKAVLGKTISIIKAEKTKILAEKIKNYKIAQLVLENKLNKLLSGIALNDDINDLISELGITFSSPFFKMGLVSFVMDGERPNKHMIKACLSTASKRLSDEKLVLYHFYNLNNELVLLFNFEDIDVQSCINQCIEEFVNIIKNRKVTCFAAVSDINKGVDGIISCYEQAKEALKYKIIFGVNTIIEYNNIKKLDSINLEMKTFDNIFIKLKEYILTYNTVEISNLIDEVVDPRNFRKCSVQMLDSLYRRFINVVRDIIEDNGLTDNTEKYADFDIFNSINDMKIYLKTLLFETVKLLKENRASKSIVEIAKRYIEKNYYKEIDMTIISNMFSISYSYFSKIFKDGTGMNFSDYLTKVRMEKSLELLNDPTNKIQDIAERVGYSNPKNFTRAFKNYFGFSPTEYRKN